MSEKMKKLILKPCPFCGAKGPGCYGTPGAFRVRCNACISSARLESTREGAAEAWNRRANER